jgi:hypothetical protein
VEHGEEMLIRAMHRQNENPDERGFLLDATRRLHTVQPRHRNVHQDNIRLQSLGHFDGGIPGESFADHLHVGLAFQQEADAAPHDGVVVGDQDPDPLTGHRSTLRGEFESIGEFHDLVRTRHAPRHPKG